MLDCGWLKFLGSQIHPAQFSSLGINPQAVGRDHDHAFSQGTRTVYGGQVIVDE